MCVQSFGQEDPLEGEIVIHSSILAGEIQWTGEPGGVQRVGHNLVTKQQQRICSLGSKLC